MSQDEALWSGEELARFLNLPRQTLYRWAHLGVGPAPRKIGRHTRYVPAECRRWVVEQADPPGAA